MCCSIVVIPPAGVAPDIDRFLKPRRTTTKKSPWHWSQSTTYHLTLAFMANHPGHRVEELTQVLNRWTERHALLVTDITGTDGFRGPERVKVLCLGIPGTAAIQLGEWFRQPRALVTHHGGSPDGMGFRARATIVRIQCTQNVGRLLQALDIYESREFVIDEVALTKSRPTNRTYKAPYRATLRGRATTRRICTSVRVRIHINAMAKRTRDPEGRRKKILQAIGGLIEEIGVNATTHREATERVRMSLGPTTQYFKPLINMLAEVLTGLGEEREEELVELSEVGDPVSLVADMVMEFLADLKRTRNKMFFALLCTTRSKLRRFIAPGDTTLVEQLSRSTPEATGRAVLAYCYEVLFQAVAQNAVTPREEIEKALCRLIGDSAERGDP